MLAAFGATVVGLSGSHRAEFERETYVGLKV